LHIKQVGIYSRQVRVGKAFEDVDGSGIAAIGVLGEKMGLFEHVGDV